MRTFIAASALLATLAACADTGAPKKSSNGKKAHGFTRAEQVRFTSPANGDVVTAPFVVDLEGGADVASVEITASGSAVSTTTLDEAGTRSMWVDLPPGEWTLKAQGVATTGEPLGSHEVTIRTEAEGEPQWVLVTSPGNGDVVTNPVSFSVRTSADIDTVEILADDWSLGTVAPDGVLTYEFSGTGYERDIVVRGMADGEAVAETALSITVQDGSAPPLSEVNALIMDILTDYPTDGSYTYWWPDDSYGWFGNPHDIHYDGRLWAAGDPERRSYCVGITLEVFFRAFERLDDTYGLDGDLNGVSYSELDEFRKDWFVRDLYGRGIVDAMDNYGIGDRVTRFEDVQPGDIIQFWRHSGSGHNAIFIDWETDASDNIVGFTYWSTQGSTDGIGYNDEYFGASGSRVDPNYFFAGRVRSPVDWQPWW